MKDTLVDRSIARIRGFLAQPGNHRAALAKLASLRESTIRDIASEDWNPTASTLRALELAIPADFEPSKGDEP